MKTAIWLRYVLVFVIGLAAMVIFSIGFVSILGDPAPSADGMRHKNMSPFYICMGLAFAFSSASVFMSSLLVSTPAKTPGVISSRLGCGRERTLAFGALSVASIFAALILVASYTPFGLHQSLLGLASAAWGAMVVSMVVSAILFGPPSLVALIIRYFFKRSSPQTELANPTQS